MPNNTMSNKQLTKKCKQVLTTHFYPDVLFLELIERFEVMEEEQVELERLLKIQASA
jgi:hypothetical protein|tara:strand:- start:2455 stop:2625 length:171 start_codon:yes stop_codon:yes gene_type:complete